ncbi:MAG: hypothetical protein JNJ58_08825 [Chitinophagaceae bacterium]|nr:hypothetical protein [Chitinophagaceae bacterium]
MSQKFQLSEKESINLRNDDFTVIGTLLDRTAVYIRKDDKAEILLLNAGMQTEKRITLSNIHEGFDNIHFNCMSRQLLIFYEVKENKNLNVYGMSLGENFSVSEPKQLNSSAVGQFRNNTEYTYAYSADHRRTLIYTHFKVEGQLVLQAVVIDDNLNELKRYDQLLNLDDLVIDDMAAISNEGNPYILLTDKMAYKGNAEQISILSGSGSATEMKPVNIDLKKHEVTEVKFLIDNPNGNLYLAGLYSEGRYSAPRGIYFAVFDEKQNVLKSEHFVALSMQVSNGKADLRDMKVKGVSLKSDGGIEVVTEKYYQNVRTLTTASPTMGIGMMSMPDNTRTINEFNYDEIILFNIKPEGGIAWTQVILKEQMSTDDGGIYLSFGQLEHKLGKVFIFNDLNSSNKRLMASYVSMKGETSIKELQTNEQVDDWNLMPRSARQVSKSAIVMPCVMKNNLCFLKISY